MTAVPPPGPAPTPAPAPPRPVHGLGIAVAALGGAVLLAGLLRIVATWQLYGVLFAGPEGEVGTILQRSYPSLLLLLTSLILLVPTLVAAVITTLVWVHRARTNAGVLSPHLRFRHTPASSVALLLVPIANLWFLRPILEDISAGSGRDGRSARLVRLFWTVTVGSAAVSLLGNLAFTAAGALTDGPVDPGMATANGVFATLEYVLLVACTVLFALVVRQVSRQQTAVLFAQGAPW